MDILMVLFYGIPAGIIYSALMLYILGEIKIYVRDRNHYRIHLRHFRKRLNNIKKDDDEFCIREKVLLAIDDYRKYMDSYGRYPNKAEEALWKFLIEYMDKDKLFLEEL